MVDCGGLVNCWRPSCARMSSKFSLSNCKRSRCPLGLLLLSTVIATFVSQRLHAVLIGGGNEQKAIHVGLSNGDGRVHDGSSDSDGMPLRRAPGLNPSQPPPSEQKQVQSAQSSHRNGSDGDRASSSRSDALPPKTTDTANNTELPLDELTLSDRAEIADAQAPADGGPPFDRYRPRSRSLLDEWTEDAAAAGGHAGHAAPRRTPRQNVLLIIADDLRADFVNGVYGDARRSVTPRLDE